MNELTGLYIDDIRPLPGIYVGEGWEIARNYDEAIHLLSTHHYDIVSFDHDIASWDENGREMTGYDVLLWIVQRKMDGLVVPNEYRIHSANPVGRDRMKGVIQRYLTVDAP